MDAKRACTIKSAFEINAGFGLFWSGALSKQNLSESGKLRRPEEITRPKLGSVKML